MTGFDKKIVHFRFDPIQGGPAVTSVTFTIQCDFTGAAGHRGSHFYMEPWNTVETVVVKEMPVGSGE